MSDKLVAEHFIFIDLLATQQRVYGKPPLQGVLRQTPEDFFVDEQLGFEPEGDGEHVFVHIEKTGANTQFVAEELARFANVAAKQVSFSGMKDRWAVTRQWFSVHLPGKDTPDFSQLKSDEVNVLAQSRHPRKLRRGVHRSNRFVITLRQIKGDREAFIARAAIIAKYGVANYFGEQRFGRGANNLSSAQRWFSGAFKPRRNQQGIYLSAVRSFLFNQVLSERVALQNWSSYVPGDIVMLEGTHSVFLAEQQDGIEARLAEGDIHCTGPLYGKAAKLMCQDDAAVIENAILAKFTPLLVGLEKQGLNAERRALRLIPRDFNVEFTDQDSVSISFELPTGCFATAVIAELVDYNDVSG